VLSLPLATGRIPGSGSLQSLLGSRASSGPDTLALAVSAQGGASTQRSATPAGGSGREQGTYRITPERRALLNTIRYAEGTWTAGRPDGYRMIYGGSLVSDLERHPEITERSTYLSAAAGAYQFLPGTWQEAARSLGLRDFQPRSQDQAALYLVEKRGALARFDRHGLCPEVLARLAPEWASLPSRSGGSYYGQPVHGADTLLRFYRAELARLRGSQPPAPAQQA